MLGPADADQLLNLHINTKRAQLGQVEAHYGPLVPTEGQCERHHRPRAVLPLDVFVDEVANLVAQLGHGSLMAKVYIESAYRLIPVHPQDCPLQAMKWKGKIYEDPMLPFGLCSAPKIYNAMADVLSWIIGQAGVRHCHHYLDDFIVVGPPHSPECHKALDAHLRKAWRAIGSPQAGWPIGMPCFSGDQGGLAGLTIETTCGQTHNTARLDRGVEGAQSLNPEGPGVPGGPP